MDLSSMINTIREILAKAENKRAKNKLSLPTPKEIDSEEISKLAKRLKGESEKETLTNILEWQDRNIRFWHERWIGNLSVVGIICIFLFLLFLSSFISSLPYIGGVALRVNLVILSLLIFIGIMIGIIIIIFLICYLFLLRFTRYYKIGWKAVYYIYYTLFPYLPVNKIMEYKLALCRDYSRLTASLLFNLYSEVFFIQTTWHETVGVELKDEIYVLDQRLPISTIDNDRYAKAKIFRATKDSKGNITLKQEQIVKIKTLSVINSEELTKEVAKLLKIKQNSPKNKPDFEIPLKGYVKNEYDALIKFHDDEIIKYSLIRAIKNRLESELCSNMDKISKIIIRQDKEDLILEVYEDEYNSSI
jgi:predicted transglutaminase-like protease